MNNKFPTYLSYTKQELDEVYVETTEQIALLSRFLSTTYDVRLRAAAHAEIHHLENELVDIFREIESREDTAQ